MQDLGMFGYRNITGTFWHGYSEAEAASFAPRLVFWNKNSNQEKETYPNLGAPPGLKKTGKSEATTEQALDPKKYELENIEFDAEWAVRAKDAERDKSGQILATAQMWGGRGAEHWDELLSQVIELGETAICLDGQPFFSNAHARNKSGTQKNLFTSSDSPRLFVVDKDNPTATELAKAIAYILGVQYGYKDDQGYPSNKGGKAFTIMVPNAWGGETLDALFSDFPTVGLRNPLVGYMGRGYTFNCEINPWLTKTDRFYLMREDGVGGLRPFIAQEEKPLTVDVLGPGTEWAKKNNSYLYIARARRNVGCGWWQYASEAVLDTD